MSVRRQPSIRLPVAAFLLAIGLAWAPGAAAQHDALNIPEPVVRKLLKLGLENIHHALCDGFNECKPTTPDELENPPITVDQARMAVVIGVRSAFARWCGFDVERRSILPFSRQLRQVLHLNNRQVALMAVIHGIQQGITGEQLKTKGQCDESSKHRLDAQLPKS